MNRISLLALGMTILLTACGGGGTSSGSGGSGNPGTGGSAPGSGGSGTGTGGTGGAAAVSALQQACRDLCVSEGEHNCHMDPLTTVEKCMSYRCPPVGEPNSRESPASCATAYTNYYKCLTAQQKAGTANPEAPTKPGCQEPGTCTAEADAFATANCP